MHATTNPGALHGYFAYRLLDDRGNGRRGLVRLPVTDRGAARLLLEERHGCAVVGLARLPGGLDPALDALDAMTRRRPPPLELANFLHGIGVMLRGGLPIDRALTEVDADDSHPSVRALARGLLRALRGGRTLSEGLDEWQAVVPDAVRALIGIGEQSGRLDAVMLDAAAHVRRMHALSRDVRKAMIYPAFVLVSILAASLFWVYYVLPDLSTMFRQMGVKLPPLTVKVVATVHAIDRFVSAGSYLLGGGLLAAVAFAMRSETVKYGLYWLAHRLPGSRTISRASSLAFVTGQLAMLHAAGIALPECLVVLERSTGNRLFRTGIRRIREGVMRGNRLSEEMGRSGLFPRMVVRLVGIGEQTGELDAQLAILADEFQRRHRHVVESLAEVVKPLVVSLAGLFFIFVVVVFLLPVYGLIADSVRR